MSTMSLPVSNGAAPAFDARSHAATSFALEDTRTHDNLKESFAVETQAAQLFTRFARISEIEGFPEVAVVFREIAESRAGFAHGHLDFLMRAADPLGGAAMGETSANLPAALALQEAEGPAALDERARTAQAEGFADIASWFTTLARSRAAHSGRIAAALAAFTVRS